MRSITIALCSLVGGVVLLVGGYSIYMHISTPTKLTLENHSGSEITEIRITVVGDTCEIDILLSDARASCSFQPQEEGMYNVSWISYSEPYSVQFGYFSPEGTFGDLAAFKDKDTLVHLDEHYFF